MRRTAKNPSGKWLQMDAEQVQREQDKFNRAVERQRELDERRAALAKGRVTK